MVKKIRVIENEDTPVTEEQTMMEIAKSMDWKLWELLQTMQRLEKKLTVLATDEDSDADVK
tara:strand:- start:1800 stop:1982 length:183 start_codon:yes stop_codon:yes gene_type:complete